MIIKGIMNLEMVKQIALNNCLYFKLNLII